MYFLKNDCTGRSRWIQGVVGWSTMDLGLAWGVDGRKVGVIEFEGGGELYPWGQSSSLVIIDCIIKLIRIEFMFPAYCPFYPQLTPEQIT